MATVLSQSETPPFVVDDRWALLHRVVESRELKRASRLRELLLYLGTRSLEGGAHGIREQEVGAAVFGRPEDYDTNLDNIVRVNVSELRKRLAHYFLDEGVGETMLLEVPRGGYLLVFTPRPPVLASVLAEDRAQASAVVEESAPALPEAMGASPGHTSTTETRVASSAPRAVARSAAAALALLACLAGCGLLLWQNHTLRTQMRPWQADTRLAAFWTQFFGSGEEVDIVSADASFALEQDLLRRPISLDDYLDFKYKDVSNLPGLSPDLRDALNLVLDRNNGSVGDFQVAERVMALDGHSSALKLATARSYTPESIKQNNVILIGSRESNPWVELYKDRMNFYVEYEPARHRSYILNRAPIAGEPNLYELAEDRNHGYSVVAFLPNLSAHRYALVIAGTDSQATRAAGEFVTSSEGLAAIRQKLPADRFPYFEVVLSSSKLVGTPLRTEIQAFRGHVW